MLVSDTMNSVERSVNVLSVPGDFLTDAFKSNISRECPGFGGGEADVALFVGRPKESGEVLEFSGCGGWGRCALHCNRDQA